MNIKSSASLFLLTSTFIAVGLLCVIYETTALRTWWNLVLFLSILLFLLTYYLFSRFLLKRGYVSPYKTKILIYFLMSVFGTCAISTSLVIIYDNRNDIGISCLSLIGTIVLCSSLVLYLSIFETEEYP